MAALRDPVPTLELPMRPMLARSAVLLAPIAALALVLGGCTAETPDEDTAVTADAEEPTEDAEEPAEETEPVEEDDSEAAAGGGAACVEGTWVSDAEAIAANTTSALGVVEAEVTVTGGSITTFAGTAITQEYTDQVTEVSWTMEGQEFRLVSRFDGTVTGTATVTVNQITIAGVDNSALTVESSTSIGGEEVDFPGLAEAATTSFEMGGASSYSCSGDELRLTPIVEGVDTSDFVTVLRRQ